VIGTTIGPYQILAKLGEGGMGEVYRANDTSLGRQVAIKVLPAAFAADADRVARFAREARILASLNHPNIAIVYGLERLDPSTGSGQVGRDGQDGRAQALVMELVEGPTLADRLAEGPLPIDKAISVARQIAYALEAAHDQGIVHRDLKPGNIKLRSDGTVKVLDFGLAKAVTTGRSLEMDLANSPTITSPAMTGVGVIAGTAAYMSPEQASGQFVDKRSDIWAFGCVLFEMLTGRRVFHAATVTATMAAVLERTVDLSGLPPATPQGVRTVLRRTLERHPQRRLHDIADARIELDDDAAPVAPQSSRPVASWVAAGVLALLAIGAAGWYAGSAFGRLPAAPAPVIRMSFPLDRLVVGETNVVALSPDGGRLAYVAPVQGRNQLFVRELSQFDSVPVPNSDGAGDPAFSPDGNWIAFTAEGRIKKVAAAGGVPLTVSETGSRFGMSWESNESILFHPARATGIWRVAADGSGTPIEVTTLRPGEVEHQTPSVLPGRKALLFDAGSATFLHSLTNGERRMIVQGSGARYVNTGHILYVRDGTLFSSPFDVSRLEVTGPPVAVIQGVRQIYGGLPLYAVSEAGTLTYVPAASSSRGARLVWVGRDGLEEETSFTERSIYMPRLSPDGTRVLMRVGPEIAQTTAGDIWMFDLVRNTRTRLTADNTNRFPVWAPDGRTIAHSSGREGRFDVVLKRLDGTAPDQALPAISGTNYPMSWSPDGRFLAAVSVSPSSSNDVWVYDLAKTPLARPFLQTRFGEGGAAFSPDGAWIAYGGDRTGRVEIYMRPFPGPGAELTVSLEGGYSPMWSRKSGELFYRQGNAMFAVDVRTSPTLVVGTPRKLFEKPQYGGNGGFWANYDVTADGKRFLMVKNEAPDTPNRVDVVLNWFSELKKLAH